MTATFIQEHEKNLRRAYMRIQELQDEVGQLHTIIANLGSAAQDVYVWTEIGELKSRDVRALADALEAAGFDPDDLTPYVREDWPD